MNFSASLKELGIKGLQDLTSREREILYSGAYGMYQAGDYTKAAGIFTKLLLHFPFESRFWKGLASSRQMQKEYHAALHAWGVFSLLSGHSPDSHFHAAECYLSLGDITEAKKALNCAKLHLEKGALLAKKIDQLEKEACCG